MSNFLHKPNETFFIDIDLLLSTDLFVVDQIYRYLYRFDDKNDKFYTLKLAVDVDGIGYENLNSLLQLKNNLNPLLEFMNIPDSKVADEYYNGILFDNSYTTDSYFTTLTLTKLGRALVMLTRDTNLDNIYVHTPMLTESLFSYIMDMVPDKNKWNFVVGSREEFLREYECNNYFVHDVATISTLAHKRHIIEGNIYIPEYNFNMNKDMPILLDSPVPVNDLNSKYNLKINSIVLPLF